MPAIRASHALVESPNGDDLTAAGVSLCLTTGHSPSVLKRQKWFTIGCLVCGLLGLAVGGGIALWLERDPQPNREAFWLAVAAPFSLAGMVCLFLPATCSGWVMRKYLGARLNELKRSPTVSELLYVEIENAATFHKMKVATEDAGYLALDPTNRCVVIEGVVCRYVVHARDVTSLATVESPGGVGTEIAYRVAGSVPLRIIVSRMSIWSEVLRQTVRVIRNPVLKKLQQTLEFPQASAVEPVDDSTSPAAS